jgi:uncharacterized protein YukE
MTYMLLAVETVSNVQDQIVKKQAQITEMLTAITAAVQGLEEGAWVGHSATQFFLDYDATRRGLGRELEIMRALAERMKQEIEEWKEAAARLA